MENLSLSRSQCVIMGDFNIDLNVDDRHSRQFINMMFSYSLIPAINLSTWVTENSATLTGNIFVNTKQNVRYFRPRVIINDISDNFGATITCEVKGFSPHGSGSKKDRTYFINGLCIGFRMNRRK